MKRFSFKLGMMMIVSVLALVFIGCATLNPIENLIGVYKGSYFATQGETGFTLNVYREGFYYYAVFDTYNLPGMNNNRDTKSYMSMNFNRSTNKWELEQTQWIVDPGGYAFIRLIGTLEGNVFSGDVTWAGGGRSIGTFRGVR